MQKRFLGLFGLFCFSMLSMLCSAQPHSKEYPLTGFTSIDIDCDLDVYFQQGSQYAVRVEATETRFLELLLVEVKKETLSVSISSKDKKEYRRLFEHATQISDTTSSVCLVVTLPELTSLKVRGSGNVKSTGSLSGKSFSCDVKGNGTVFLPALLIQDKVSLSVKGNGNFKARSVVCNGVNFTAEGNGDVRFDTVRVTKNMAMQLKGNGAMALGFLHGDSKGSMNINGNGNVDLEKVQWAGDFQLNVSGNGNFTVDQLQVEKADFTFEGNGSMSFDKGSIKKLKMKMKRKTRCDMLKIPMEEADVEVEGGTIILDVSKKLHVKGDTRGTVEFKGNPALSTDGKVRVRTRE